MPPDPPHEKRIPPPAGALIHRVPDMTLALEVELSQSRRQPRAVGNCLAAGLGAE
jgi:hypothetical protein